MSLLTELPIVGRPETYKRHAPDGARVSPELKLILQQLTV